MALLPIVLKASLLMVVAALACVTLFRRSSAASRHLLWAFTVAGLLALPPLSFVLPAWEIEVGKAGGRNFTSAEPAAAAAEAELKFGPTGVKYEAPAGESATADAEGEPKFGPAGVSARIYLAGVAVLLLHLLIQQWSVGRITRRATVVTDDEWMTLLSDCTSLMGVRRPVRLLRSQQRTMPMTAGTWRPAIVIPAIADTWTDDRRRAVLLHELAHVARLDCLTQALAFVVCTIYWFHPAAWWIARRLRIERELACDDLVLGAGARARDYAGHLLEIAYAVGRHRAPALAVSMARPRQLEGRMLAVLDGGRNRRLPALRARVAGSAVAVVVLTALAGATVVTIDEATPPAVAREVGSDTAAPVAQAAPAAKVAAPVKEAAREMGRRVADGARAAFQRIQETSVPGPGSWEIQRSRTDSAVNLQMRHGTSTYGFDVPASRLEGLTDAHLTSAGGPVQFRLRRDAGTFTFEGVVRNGVGGGTYTFAPDASFAAALEKRGFARPTEAQQFQMARADVGFELIDELSRQGYGKPDLAELVRAGNHGVTATYVREMADAGYKLGTLPPLVTLRDHGVTPTYVREMAAQGYKGLPADEIRRARDHGVTTEFVRALGEAGFKNLPIEEVVRVRDHGVTPEYIQEMRALGYGESLTELVRARDHGVNAEFGRRMADLGYARVPLASLIRARDHGVTATFVDELRKMGYEKIALEDLIHLRDHGFTADRIRTLNSRAGTRLPLDVLRSIR